MEKSIKISDFWAGVHYVVSSVKWALLIPVIIYVIMFILALGGVSPEILKQYSQYVAYAAISIPVIVVGLIPVIYWVNSHAFVVKNGKIRIPAADIENNFFDLITLKRVRGLYYWVSKPVEEIVDVKYDYGRDFWNLNSYTANSKNKQWKINVTFDDGSNYQVYFSNKQKRDAAVAIIRKLRNKNKKAHIGADISF
jgi:fumarate reductase subunit D